MKYIIWLWRRTLARLFYKKWFIALKVNGKFMRTAEIDPEQNLIVVKNNKLVIKKTND